MGDESLRNGSSEGGDVERSAAAVVFARREPRHGRLGVHRSLMTFAFGVLVLVVPARGPAQEPPKRGIGLEVAQRLAQAGQPEGLYALGHYRERGREIERDPLEAVRLYEAAAKLGHVESQYVLGLLLSGAEPRVPRSLERSAEYFELAAMQGHAAAQYFFALALESGVGVDERPEEAFEWFRQAAAQGESRALGELARMHDEGPGTLQRDVVKAHAWSRLAANSGDPASRARMRRLEQEMSAEQRSGAAAMAESLSTRYGGIILDR